MKESAKAEYVEELAKAFGEDYLPNFIAADEPYPTKRADAVVADFVKRMKTALEASVGSRTVSNKFSRSIRRLSSLPNFQRDGVQLSVRLQSLWVDCAQEFVPKCFEIGGKTRI